MSGPKRSSWAINRRIEKQLRQEREARIAATHNELQKRAAQLQNQIQKLLHQYGQHAQIAAERATQWLNEADHYRRHEQFREAHRSLNGVENFLANKAEQFASRAQAARAKAERAARKARLWEFQKKQKIAEVSAYRDVIDKKLENLAEELGQSGANLLQNPQAWLKEAEANLGSNPQKAENSLKGIDKYLEQNQTRFETLRRRQQEKNKVSRHLEALATLREEYREILNPGIEQRIELFSQALKTNPDNQNTLKQIAEFKTRLAAEWEKFEEQRDQLQYIENTFSEALGGKPSPGESGGSVISGTIEGVPITVSIDKKSRNLHFNTPTDGSCQAAMEKLSKRLENAGISLGPIRVLKTGQTIGQKNAAFQPQDRQHA
jgi:hypothetical protein